MCFTIISVSAEPIAKNNIKINYVEDDDIITSYNSSNMGDNSKEEIFKMRNHETVSRYLVNFSLVANQDFDWLNKYVNLRFRDNGSQENLGFTGSVSGWSQSSWMGLNPEDCDSISHTDKFSFIGLSSLTIGGGWKVGFGGTSCEKTVSLNNDWQITHDYTFTFAGLLLTIKHELSTTFKIGNNFKTVPISDSSYL